MKILVTGAQGFVGKNLITELNNQGYQDIFAFDLDTDKAMLDTWTQDCDFVFHLAGVNRPKDEYKFDEGNMGFTQELLGLLNKHNNFCPLVFTSSIQAKLDNPYGKSKKAAEEELLNYGKETGAKVMVYRLPNLFGKWGQPYYNSVVATFCYNLARDMEIRINDPEAQVTLCYIDDLVAEFIAALRGNPNQIEDYVYVAATYSITVGELAGLIRSFKE
ncbi:MAG: NAD-dependent epimerase/dehydratase family protein, partial [Syntrophomonadaceae bacterium]|nr:NAD-dependent epimerase/dehydratase family protein [Syntrophomonadaceae bacterium]